MVGLTDMYVTDQTPNRAEQQNPAPSPAVPYNIVMDRAVDGGDDICVPVDQK